MERAFDSQLILCDRKGRQRPAVESDAEVLSRRRQITHTSRLLRENYVGILLPRHWAPSPGLVVSYACGHINCLAAAKAPPRQHSTKGNTSAITTTTLKPKQMQQLK